jgi:L-asparaginase
MDKEIKIFTMGGSIDKFYDLEASDFLVGPPAAQTLLTDANVSVEFSVEEISRKDSLEITDSDRNLLLDRVRNTQESRIIITHGTDTIVQTGQVLSVLEDKVIVLTGSMQPAAFKDSDAGFNLGGAVIAVQVLNPGVYILMNGTIFHPDKVRKNTLLKRFESI